MKVFVQTLALGLMLSQMSPALSFAGDGKSCGCGKHAAGKAGDKSDCTCEKDCKCADCANEKGSCEHKAEKKG